MNEVEFIYEGKPTIIQCNSGDKMKDICNKFEVKTQLDTNNIYYLYNGSIINKESQFDQINKGNNKISILVYDNNTQNLFLKFKLNDYNINNKFYKNF